MYQVKVTAIKMTNARLIKLIYLPNEFYPTLFWVLNLAHPTYSKIKSHLLRFPIDCRL